MALHADFDPRTRIDVEETVDTDGDIVYVLGIKTYCRSAVTRIGEIFNVVLNFRPQGDYTPNDW